MSPWESAGKYEFSGDSAVAQVIGPSAPVVDHHILLDFQATLTAWQAPMGEHDHAASAVRP